MKLLFLGETKNQSANYLSAILKWAKISFNHIDSNQKTSARDLADSYKAIVISDYSCKNLSFSLQEKIVDLWKNGCGVMMIGGWGSFAAPFGQWQKSPIENCLPVICQNQDDRVAFSNGAFVAASPQECNHPLLRSYVQKTQPIICGLNAAKPRRGSRILLHALENRAPNLLVSLQHTKSRKFSSENKIKKYPLLVLREERLRDEKDRRSVALLCDVAPHWCGGWVDWGKPVKVKLATQKEMELGIDYLNFFSGIFKWLVNAGR